MKASTLIEKAGKYTHDDHIGYINSYQTNSGTFLRAFVNIKLTKLGKKIRKKSKKLQISSKCKLREFMGIKRRQMTASKISRTREGLERSEMDMVLY